jgi:hypothetical protein
MSRAKRNLGSADGDSNQVLPSWRALISETEWPVLEIALAGRSELGEEYARAFVRNELLAIERYVIGMTTSRKECRRNIRNQLLDKERFARSGNFTRVARALHFAAVMM